MLELINTERMKAGVEPIALGDNVAAQLHAEASLENCISSHWGMDGLKPYMRYSLAGDYQSNGENGLGLNYCVGLGYQPLDNITQEIQDATRKWMDSSSHRRNILDPWHKKVNIGLAWDRYNIRAVQHFEGDYVEYEDLPVIEDNILSMSGTAKNGATLYNVQIYYDPPPHSLTRGQLSKTYCYDLGLLIAALRSPAPKGTHYTTNTFKHRLSSCLNPYDVSMDVEAPSPPSCRPICPPRTVPAPRPQVQITASWITASEWVTSGTKFSIRANLSGLLSEYRDGVYTLMVWGRIGGERIVISQYSIFHGITPPDTYTPAAAQGEE